MFTEAESRKEEPEEDVDGPEGLVQLWGIAASALAPFNLGLRYAMVYRGSRNFFLQVLAIRPRICSVNLNQQTMWGKDKHKGLLEELAPVISAQPGEPGWNALCS